MLTDKEIRKLYEKCPYNEHLADIWVEGYLRCVSDREYDEKPRERVRRNPFLDDVVIAPINPPKLNNIGNINQEYPDDYANAEFAPVGVNVVDNNLAIKIEDDQQFQKVINDLEELARKVEGVEKPNEDNYVFPL